MYSRPSRAPRIYLAGPDVFRRDSTQTFAELKARCAAWGLEGVAPTDAQIQLPAEAEPGDALAQRLYAGNIRLIQETDAVAANLEAFRGLEPDSGTVFEMGYAVALGKPVVAYNVSPLSYEARVCAAIPCVRDPVGVMREEASGLMVEGLGQRLNLMLTQSARIETTLEAALQYLAQALRGQG